MTHLTIELILWLLLAFFIGCIIGYLLRWLFAPEPKMEAPTSTVAAAAAGSATAATSVNAPTTKSQPVPPRAQEADAKPKPTVTATPAKVVRPAPVKPMPEAVLLGSHTAKVSPAPQAAAPVAAAKPKQSAVTGKPQRPGGLAAALGGKADNLQRISGVGPKLEKTLHGLGFYHFSQIAEWSADEVMWVDEHLRFKGRIARDDWIAQAKQLAAGDLD